MITMAAPIVGGYGTQITGALIVTETVGAGRPGYGVYGVPTTSIQ